MAKINDGCGQELDRVDIDQFVSILPSELEIQQFKDRLEENSLSSFEDLDHLKSPRVLKKLEKAEWFVIKVLKTEKVIENAKTL